MTSPYDVLQDPRARAQYDDLRRKTSNRDQNPAPRSPKWIMRSWISAVCVALAVLLTFALNSESISSRVRWSRNIQENASHVGGALGRAEQVNTEVVTQPPAVRPVRGEAPTPVHLTTQENDCNGGSIGVARGNTMQYVSPYVGAVNLWSWKPGKGYVKGALITPFTNVAVLARIPETQLAEVCLAAGTTAYIDSRHLLLGGADVARRGYCVFADGPRARNNELLRRSGFGPHQITINNLSATPAVAVMRSVAGKVTVAIYVGAQSSGSITNFPSGTYRLEFSFGKTWSRKCGQFLDDRRNQRFPDYDVFTTERSEDASGIYEHFRQAEYTISPVTNGNVRPIGMPDDEFSLE